MLSRSRGQTGYQGRTWFGHDIDSERIDMVAAESAGEFAMNGSLTSIAGRTPYYEVLVRTRAIAGTAAHSDIAATREIAAGDKSSA